MQNLKLQIKKKLMFVEREETYLLDQSTKDYALLVKQ